MPTETSLSRLKTRPEFLRVARGRRYATPGLVLQAIRRPTEEANQTNAATPGQVRVGFTATKKTGNAVRRNRIKRRLRAVSQSIFPALAEPGYDYVLVGRAETFDRPWQSLLDDLALALQMVHQPRSASAKRAKGRRRKSSGARQKDTGTAS